MDSSGFPNGTCSFPGLPLDLVAGNMQSLHPVAELNAPTLRPQCRHFLDGASHARLLRVPRKPLGANGCIPAHRPTRSSVPVRHELRVLPAATSGRRPADRFGPVAARLYRRRRRLAGIARAEPGPRPLNRRRPRPLPPPVVFANFRLFDGSAKTLRDGLACSSKATASKRSSPARRTRPTAPGGSIAAAGS